jgi:hypothetical protein
VRRCRDKDAELLLVTYTIRVEGLLKLLLVLTDPTWHNSDVLLLPMTCSW